MTDTPKVTGAPERIWLNLDGRWIVTTMQYPGDIEYVRADVAVKGGEYDGLIARLAHNAVYHDARGAIIRAAEEREAAAALTRLSNRERYVKDMEDTLARVATALGSPANDADTLIANATRLSAQLAERDARAWLIEAPEARWGTGFYWTAECDYMSWGTIDKAIRFSRKQDAEQVMGFLRSIRREHRTMEACEHEWVAARAAHSEASKETKA